MPFDWREFFIVAHSNRNDTNEGVQRTCLGRTYYYVYNLGLSNARILKFKGKPPSLHKQLWAWYQSQSDPNLKQLGTWGQRMLALRHEADYDAAPIPNIAREITIQLTRAQNFEVMVATLNSQPPPSPLPLP